MPLSSAPSSSILGEIVHLSNSDGDNSLNINQILKDAAFKRMVEELIAVVVPEPTNVGESSVFFEPNCGGPVVKPMDVKFPVAETTLVTNKNGKEAQCDLATAKKPTKSGEPAPTLRNNPVDIRGQTATSTPYAIGSVDGRTP
jgi:hypothetical protein